MPSEPRLILQVARDGAVDQQLRRDRPASVAGGDVVVDAHPPDSGGRLDPPAAGQVVLSVPSPETLTREPDAVHRVVDATRARASSRSSW